MKMQDNTSPEERLLRLIRGEKNKALENTQRLTEHAQASTDEGVKSITLTPRGRASRNFSLVKILNIARIGEQLSFNQFNHLLLLIVSIIAIYLLADVLIVSPKKIEKRILSLEEVKAESLEIKDKSPTDEPIQPISYYSQAVKARDLFTAASGESVGGPTGPSFSEMVAELRLQGIITEDKPQAIIENVKTKNIYFVSPGEFIGEIELKQILPGKVILSYYGEEAELTL